MGKIILFVVLLTTSAYLASAQPSGGNPSTGEYNLIPLCAALLIIYLAGVGLSKRKIIIDAEGHRTLWNLLFSHPSWAQE